MAVRAETIDDLGALHRGPGGANICSMREYGYTVTEHDPDRPWIVRDQRHETVKLDYGMSFFERAAGQYPREHFTVELDPWELSVADDCL